jgi:hypothetical protein
MKLESAFIYFEACVPRRWLGIGAEDADKFGGDFYHG